MLAVQLLSVIKRVWSICERLKHVKCLKCLGSLYVCVCVCGKILFHFVVSGYYNASCLKCLSFCMSGFACMHTDVFKTWHFLLTASGIPQSATLQAWQRTSLWWSRWTHNQQLPPTSAPRWPRTKRISLCLTQYIIVPTFLFATHITYYYVKFGYKYCVTW